ncbi:MAG TPA: PA2169 family four-helix-bundle protein [Pyrinomonadaceae bacterium]|nr:PA2169 family four-helix-bundle protein [Pyrinomonadaceae bacterium]
MIREHEIPSSYITKQDEFTSNTIDTLNDLIEICQDGNEGFREAAEGCDSSELKSLFTKYSNERAAYASDLQDLVRGLGGTPEHDGSLTAALHRGWMDIKTAIAGNDDAAILNECERGEDSAKKAYKEALEKELPDYVRTAVQSQYEGVLGTHDHIKSLRDTFNKEKASTAKPGL